MEKLTILRNHDELLVTDSSFQENQQLGYTEDPSFTNPLKQTIFSMNQNNQLASKEKFHNQRVYLATMIDKQVYVGSERRVAIEGLYNCRDLGGYKTESGQMTKWGYLFRSDVPDHLSAEEQAYLEKMNIETVIDLRSPSEVEKNPDKSIGESTHIQLDPHAEVAKKASEVPSSHSKNKDEQKVRMLEDLANTAEGQKQLIKWQNQMIRQMHDLVMTERSQKAYAEFLQVLNQSSTPKGFFFHCQGGKDRTGWGAALILGLLGVDKATIYQDYLLTEQYNRPRNEKRMAIYKQYTSNKFVLDYLASLQQTKVEYLDGAFTIMEQTFGTFEKYANEALGFTEADVQKLRSNYLYTAEDSQRISSLL